ncbi:MAG: peptide deformylase [Planctomycetota bacterium]
MPLEIAQLGQPILREIARKVSPEEIRSEEFQAFLDEMVATMHEGGGVGLAAPQVFDERRVFLAAIMPPKAKGETPQVECFINPRLSQLSEEKRSAWEGCLSFLELLVYVPRHRKLRIDYLDRQGEPRALELAGYPARVIQHEYDHLDGVLTIDRAQSTKDIVKASEIDDVIANGKDDDEDS